jgi:formate--tetrahydrofolate ligase
MTDLASAVADEVENGKGEFKALYNWNSSIKDKIQTIAKEIYGADNVGYSKKALLDLSKIETLGLEGLPVCMAKTQNSFSDNLKLRGRPTGFDVNVREFEFATGAGFLIPILGKMMRMPGLPAVPASEGMSIDDNGKISGLS